MEYFLRICVITAALALTGCSTQLSSFADGQGPYTKSVNGPIVAIGPDYGIPMLQFNLKVRRTLIQCEENKDSPRIRFLSKVEAEPGYVVGETPSVDYEKMSGWSKTSKFELLTYASGVLKSINAQAEDHTMELIGNVVKSGVSVLSLASGVPLPPLATNATGRQTAVTLVCTAAARSALAGVDDSTKSLKAQTAQLVAFTDEVSRLERSAGLGALTEDGKAQLDLMQKKVAAQAKLTAKTDHELAAFLGRLSATEEMVWPRSPVDRVLNAAPNPKTQAFLRNLFEENKERAKGYERQEIDAAMQLRGRLEPVVTPAPLCDSANAACQRRAVPEDQMSGLLYRSPVPGRLLICEDASDANCAVGGASGVVVSAPVLVPQLGRLRVLPFRNGVFQNNELRATFREDGGLSSINYDEKTARGLELSEAVSSGLERVVSARDAARSEKEKRAVEAKSAAEEKKQAELDALDLQIARLEKLKKINELNTAASQTTSIADMEVETARLDARLALLEAQRKVRDAEAALAAGGS